MKYCENCRALTDGDSCPLCGAEKLREVRDGDFCLLAEVDAAYGSALKEIFDGENIPCSALPYGSGVEARFGLPLQNCRLFVPYGFYDKAKSIIEENESGETEELRNLLLENADKLNISRKLEKRILKKLRVPEDFDLFGYCIKVIETAYKIEDKGADYDGGRYLYCSSENARLSENSKSFEILSLTVDKN